MTYNEAGLARVSATVHGTTLPNPQVSTSASVTPSGPNGSNGWYVTAPTVGLAQSADDPSGMDVLRVG